VTTTTKQRSVAWADPDPASIEALISNSAIAGWRTALTELSATHPFFVQRMKDLGLGNWHVLLGLQADSVALDLGCGFGSLPLGMGHYYRTVVGIDALPSRVAYASLRARQDARTGNVFARASGLDLPFRTGSFDLVTLNGVLEWAGLYGSGDPRDLQLRMLSEVHRALRPTGIVGVAIENRFAMETLVGMPDTHTSLRFAPALPRGLADRLARLIQNEPFRTYLYGGAGYMALARDAGFAAARVFDLVSSYNDYDYVIDTRDALSYRLLWSRDAIRTFYPRAGKARRAIAKVRPSVLGRFGYAFLLLAGQSPITVLDPTHPFWMTAISHGVEPGLARFACKGAAVGTMVMVTHDSRRPEWVIELGIGLPQMGISGGMREEICDRFLARTDAGPTWNIGNIQVRAHRAGY
jgi:SAM-dependent methyltransferase